MKSATTKPNKSEAIREWKRNNPAHTPKEVAQCLAVQSPPVKVSAQFVSTVLSNAKKKGGKVGKRGPKPKVSIAVVSQTAPAKKSNIVLDALEAVAIARKLSEVCERMGVEPIDVIKASRR